MATTDFKSVSNLDLSRNQLVDAGLQLLAAAPATPFKGQVAFNAIAADPDINHPVVYLDAAPAGWRRMTLASFDETISGFWKFSRSGSPFEVLGSSVGVLVTGLNADMLDGFHANQNAISSSIAQRYTDGRLRVGAPVESGDAVTKSYADGLAGGNKPVAGGPVRVATVAELPGSYSAATNAITASANGPPSVHAPVFDLVTLVLDDRVLFKDQTPTFSNGVFYLSTVGTASTPCVFTRTTDADEPDEVTVGATVNVVEGATARGHKYRQSQPVANVDTDPQIWVLDSTTDLVAGPGIVITGNKVSFVNDTSYTSGALFYATVASPSVSITQLAPATGVLRSDGGAPYWGTETPVVLPTLQHRSLSTALTVTPSTPVAQAGAALEWTYSIDPSALMQVANPSKLVDVGAAYQFPADGGTATSALRSDVQLRVSTAIIPTWSELHTFSGLSGGISTVATNLAAPAYFATFAASPGAGTPSPIRSSLLSDVRTALKVPVPGTPANKVALLPKASGTTAEGTAYLGFDSVLELDQAIGPFWSGAHTWWSAATATVAISTQNSAAPDGANLWQVSYAGTLGWGTGAETPDVFLGRSASKTLEVQAGTGDSLFVLDNVQAKAGLASLGVSSFVLVMDNDPVGATNDPAVDSKLVKAAGKVAFKSWLGSMPAEVHGLDDHSDVNLTVFNGAAIKHGLALIYNDPEIDGTGEWVGGQIQASNIWTTEVNNTSAVLFGARADNDPANSGLPAAQSIARVGREIKLGTGLALNAYPDDTLVVTLAVPTASGSAPALVGLGTPAAGSASPYRRADAVFAIDTAIAPTWSGIHKFSAAGIELVATAVTAGATPFFLVVDALTRSVVKAATKAEVLTSLAVPLPSDVAPGLVGTGTPAAGNLTTYRRGNAVFAVDQAMVPAWSGKHAFGAGLNATVTQTTVTNFFYIATGLTSDLYVATQAQVASNLGALIGAPSARAGGLRMSSAVSGDRVEATVTGGTIGTGDYTLTTTIRLSAGPTTAVYGIVGVTSSRTAASANDLLIYIQNTSNLYVGWRNAGTTTVSGTPIDISKYYGQVVQLALRRTAGVEQLFLDGRAVTYTPSTGAAASMANGATPFYLHGLNYGGIASPFYDVQYSARLFNRALSDAEITELVRMGVHHADQWGNLTTPTAGCIVDLDFGGSSTTVVPDRSDRFDGAITGTVEYVAGHLHDLAGVHSSATEGVPWVASTGRLTADATKMKWTGTHFTVGGSGYFTTSLGSGITPSGAAWIEAAAGTTTKAPLRLGIGSFLTTPVLGVIEANATRPYYTDSTPTRRGLAYIDELAFTNDANGAQQGGVIFAVGDYIEAPLTSAGYTEAIGIDPYTLWTRFLVPTAFRGPSQDFVVSVQSSARGSQFPVGLTMSIGSAGQLYFYLATSGSNFSRFQRLNFTTDYGGRIVDAVVVRSPGNVKALLYINGVLQTTTDANGGTPPGWDSALTSNFLHLGTISTTQGSVTRIHRAVLFNRPLSQTEAADLSRMGISSSDQWGSTKAVFTDSFASGVGGWVATDATNNTLLGAQTVNASAGWATLTHSNVTGRADISRQNTGARINKTWGLRYRVWRTTSEPSFFGVSVGTTAGVSAKLAVAASTETQILAFCSGPTQTGSPTIRIEPGTSAAATAADSLPVGAAYSVKDPTLYQAGAVVDLDLGIGCGTAIPDRSGRYHGALAGTTWSHYIPRCPVDMTSGSGFVSYGLRRYVQRLVNISAAVTITHNLNTKDVTVQCWQDDLAAPGKFEVGVTVESFNTVKIWPNQIPVGATATVVIVG
jgi:hypothetical protein